MSNGKCSFCDKKFDEFPFTCKFCGEEFCSLHRLPENHNCLALEKYKEKQINAITTQKHARPLEYFYRKEPLSRNKRPVIPTIIIASGICLMIFGYFVHYSFYYIGFILFCAGMIKRLMPQFHA